jgi:hypothetical protein
MVLISIDPFASRRILLVIAALLCFSALCFADPVLMAQRYAKSELKPTFGPQTAADTIPDFGGVDVRSRGQELLPCGDGDRPSYPERNLFFSMSVGRICS